MLQSGARYKCADVGGGRGPVGAIASFVLKKKGGGLGAPA